MAIVRLKKRKQETQRRDESTALARRDETGLVARRKEVVALRRRVQNADLKLMLRGHALQASEIVDRAAQAEAAMLTFVVSGKSREASVLTQMIRQLEAVRSGALRDLERVARTIGELENPMPRVTVYATVPKEPKAHVVDLEPRRQLERT